MLFELAGGADEIGHRVSAVSNFGII